MKKSHLLGAVCAFMLSTPLQAAIVLDQTNQLLDTVSLSGNSIHDWQQEVTAGLAGKLTSIDVYFNGTGDVDFLVNIGAAWQADTNDYFSTVSMVVGWNTIDVSSANIFLNDGDQFVFGVSGYSSGFNPTFAGTDLDQYAAGYLYLNGSINFNTDYDLNFRTRMDVSAVPVPAAVWLFGSGLMGLISMARRKKA